MDYIMSGDPVAMAKVIQENGIRIQRGEIRFSPVGTDYTDDDKTATAVIADTKYNEPEPDVKQPKAKAKKK